MACSDFQNASFRQNFASNMELLNTFTRFQYMNKVGPAT
jgi:hypothetical protein